MDHRQYDMLFKSLIYNTQLRVIRFINQGIDYNKNKLYSNEYFLSKSYFCQTFVGQYTKLM